MEQQSIDPRNDKQVKELKKLYKEAVVEGKTQFDYHGQPVLVQFAKYMIQHIDNVRDKMEMKKIK